MTDHAQHVVEYHRRRMVEAFMLKYPRLIPYLKAHLPRLLVAALGRGHDEADIEQQGWAGVLHAARLHDPAKANGGGFATYALWHVRGAVSRLAYRRSGEPHPCDVASLNHEFRDAGGDGGVVKFQDTFGREDAAPAGDAAAWWDALLARLKPREAEVVRLRYREGVRPSEIARRLGRTKSRVGQIEAKALARLRVEAQDLAP